MIDSIRSVIQNTLTHWGLTDYVPGMVISISPLKVKIEERLILEKNSLLLTTGLGTVSLGDKVIMLRVLRGQKFILLSKVVEV